MTAWDTETVFDDGDIFYEDLCLSIDRASRSVDLETYIFHKDRIGGRVVERLAEAARRGVRVRLMLDGVGCASWTLDDVIPLAAMGIQVRFYHPLPWQVARRYAFWRLFAVHRWAVRVAKLNRRNHRKTCVIDGSIAYAGGMNISEWHAASAIGSGAWRDTSVRVSGEGVAEIRGAFERAWSGTRSAIYDSELVLHNFNRRQRKQSYTHLIRRILAAESRVWITNAYFVPELGLIRVLRFAAWSGRDVRLLVPARPDVFGIKRAIMAFYLPLLAAGVRVYEYQPSMLHAKVVLIDDWARVGSTNLNHRSLFHDLEIDVTLTHLTSTAAIGRQFVRDLTFAKEVKLSTWSRRPWIGRILERFALVFRRWL